MIGDPYSDSEEDEPMLTAQEYREQMVILRNQKREADRQLNTLQQRVGMLQKAVIQPTLRRNQPPWETANSRKKTGSQSTIPALLHICTWKTSKSDEENGGMYECNIY